MFNYKKNERNLDFDQNRSNNVNKIPTVILDTRLVLMRDPVLHPVPVVTEAVDAVLILRRPGVVVTRRLTVPVTLHGRETLSVIRITSERL